MSRCAYCSATATTRDHVPPGAFFSRPRPGDLITVPCCASCNTSLGFSDAYVRAVIQLRDDVSASPRARGLLDVVLRGLERPQAAGLRSRFADARLEVDVSSRAGIYLGRRDAVLVETARMDAFVARLARGLFYEHFEQPVPETFLVTPISILEAAPEVLAQFVGFASQGPRSVGDGVFSYWWGEALDSALTTVWLMVFYGLVPFGALVRNPDDPSMEGQDAAS